MPNLIGIKLKLRRANQHLQELNASIQRFLESSSHTAFSDFNAQEGRYEVRIKLTPFPDDWPLLIGDAVHNLRSALDYMVCDLALIGNTPDCSETEFPIFVNQREHARARDRIRRLTQGQRAFVIGKQPYDRPDDPLWLLHNMDITDKHRTILLVRGVTNFTGISGYVSEATATLAVESADVLREPIEDNAIVGWYRVVGGRADATAYVNFKMAFTILFGRGTPEVEGRDTMKTLSNVYQHVSTIVSECEKQFFSSGSTVRG